MLTGLRRQEGFSLLELSVVLLIISVLLVVGMAAYIHLAKLGANQAAQVDLTTAVKVQSFQHLQVGAFTDHVGTLASLEPRLQYSDDGTPGTILVEIEGAADAVCLFAQTEHGTWFAVHHTFEGIDRYAESGPVDCTAESVANWSTESW